MDWLLWIRTSHDLLFSFPRQNIDKTNLRKEGGFLYLTVRAPSSQWGIIVTHEKHTTFSPFLPSPCCVRFEEHAMVPTERKPDAEPAMALCLIVGKTQTFWGGGSHSDYPWSGITLTLDISSSKEQLLFVLSPKTIPGSWIVNRSLSLATQSIFHGTAASPTFGNRAESQVLLGLLISEFYQESLKYSKHCVLGTHLLAVKKHMAKPI